MAKKAFKAIEWSEIDARLPTGQDPDSREKRKQLFNGMDPNGNGKLSLTELQGGLPPLLVDDDRKSGEGSQSLLPMIDDFKPAVKLAYTAARNLQQEASTKNKKRRGQQDTNVDLPEFHALLVSFRYYIELQAVFETIERDGSKMLNFKECKAGLDLLESWNLDAKKLRSRFPDEWTETMKYDDFAEWCIKCKLGELTLKLDDSDDEEVRYEKAAHLMRGAADCKQGDKNNELTQSQNKRKVMEVFSLWDSDNSGTIDKAELTRVLTELDPKLTTAQLDTMFDTADANKDGMISYEEFTNWLFKGMS